MAIEGEGLEQVRDALNHADIPTIGPPFTRFIAEAEQQTQIGHRMTAVLDADTGTAAEARVRDHLPEVPEGDFAVGPAEPWPPELTP